MIPLLNFPAVIALFAVVQVNAFNFWNELMPRASQKPKTSSSNNFISSLKATAVEPLAQEGSWIAYLDNEKTGLLYYFNSLTGERSWTPPSRTFPIIPASRWMPDGKDKTLKDAYVKQSKSKSFSIKGIRNSNVMNGFMTALDAEKKTGTRRVSKSKLESTSNNSNNINDNNNIILNQDVIVPITQPIETFFNRVIKDVEEQATTLGPLLKHQTETRVKSMIDNNEYIANVKGAYNDLINCVENTKTFMAGFVAGGIAISPIIAFQDVLLKSSLSDEVMNKFYFDTSVCSFECAIFALILRYCVREDQKDNKLWTDSVVAAVVLLRTTSLMTGDSLDWNMVQHIAVGGIESFVMFSTVAAAYDFACMCGLISRAK